MTDEANDERLLADLGRALGPDPAPPGLVGRADALFAVRDLDAGLAALLDAPLDIEAAEPAGMRGGDVAAAHSDRLTFEPGDGSVTVEVSVERDRIAGRVFAEEPLTVTLERPGGSDGPMAGVPVGDLGDFAFDAVGTGPRRLRLDGMPGGPVRTDWFLV